MRLGKKKKSNKLENLIFLYDGFFFLIFFK